LLFWADYFSCVDWFSWADWVSNGFAAPLESAESKVAAAAERLLPVGRIVGTLLVCF
jgi:hypothetical protein